MPLFQGQKRNRRGQEGIVKKVGGIPRECFSVTETKDPTC